MNVWYRSGVRPTHPVVIGAMLLVLGALAAVGCSRSETAAVPVGGPRFVPAAPTGDVDALVRDALHESASEHRKLVVYVGASWCEPCARMHRAVEHGDLDRDLPGVTFYEFDWDRDNQRLSAAGYRSKLIPLFALPTPDGKASDRRVEGGIKGEGAVGYIAPRLKELLERSL